MKSSVNLRAATTACALLIAGLAVTSDVNAAPAWLSSTVDVPPTPLDGTYRIDVFGSRGTFDGQPRAHGDSMRWYAFRSSCAAGTCTAEAIQLDDANHDVPRPSARELEFTFEHRKWVGAPFTDTSPCLADPDVDVALSVAWALTPQADGTLVGTRTITELNRGSGVCAGTGGIHRDPVTATRISLRANGFSNVMQG